MTARDPVGVQDQAEGLAPFRGRLDALDDRILGLLGERFGVCREVAAYKRAHEIPMMQPDRVQQVRGRYLARGEQVALAVDFTAALFELVVGTSCRMEDELLGGSGDVVLGAARDQ
jgi:chorismate mutase